MTDLDTLDIEAYMYIDTPTASSPATECDSLLEVDGPDQTTVTWHILAEPQSEAEDEDSDDKLPPLERAPLTEGKASRWSSICSEQIPKTEDTMFAPNVRNPWSPSTTADRSNTVGEPVEFEYLLALAKKKMEEDNKNFSYATCFDCMSPNDVEGSKIKPSATKPKPNVMNSQPATRRRRPTLAFLVAMIWLASVCYTFYLVGRNSVIHTPAPAPALPADFDARTQNAVEAALLHHDLDWVPTFYADMDTPEPPDDVVNMQGFIGKKADIEKALERLRERDEKRKKICDALFELKPKVRMEMVQQGEYEGIKMCYQE